MKTAQILLAVSLVINGALVAVALLDSAPAVRVPSAEATNAVTSDARGVVSAEESLHQASADPHQPPCTWAALNSTDPTRLAQNLTGAGFPRAAVRALVQFVVREQFADRQAEILGPRYEDLPMRLLERERLADIAAALTPEEFAEYQLRNSQASNTAKSRLETFVSTEAEFRAIVPIYSTSATTGFSAADDAQIAAVLTPERYADYRQAIAPGANKLNRLMVRLGLPLSAGTPVDAAQSDLKERAAVIRKDNTLSDSERATRLAALADEATEKITAILGPRNFDAYHDYNGGWIDELRAKPRGP